MKASGIDSDGFYGNSDDVTSKQSPSGETEDARQMRCQKQRDQVVETGSSRRTKPYACADCRYATDRKNNLRRHRATMHERCERALECCGLTFVSKSELRDHVTENHGAGAGYACAECGRRFGRRALMRRHAAVHAAAAAAGDVRPSAEGPPRRRSTVAGLLVRRYACVECDYTTGHKSNLDRHLRRHCGLSLTTTTDSHSTFTDSSRYPPLKTNNEDAIQPTAFPAISHRVLSVPRSTCRCQICIANLYYRHQMPPPSPLISLSSRTPFAFNLLPPRFADVARSFCKSILPEVDVRRLWSAQAVDRRPSTEESGDIDNLEDDMMTSKNDVDQLGVDDGLHHDESMTSSTGDAAAAGEETSIRDVIDDVTGTCFQRRRRLRLLPLLHTCRSCALTFVSQLQLKFHCDLFHRSNEFDARPICYRTNKSDVVT